MPKDSTLNFSIILSTWSFSQNLSDLHSWIEILLWLQDWFRHNWWFCRCKILIQIYPWSSHLKLIWTCACDNGGRETQNSIFVKKLKSTKLYSWLFLTDKMNSYHIIRLRWSVLCEWLRALSRFENYFSQMFHLRN